MRTHAFRPPSARPTGSILLLALVLLLLAGLLTVVALKAGVYEQRSTGNDVRARVVEEVAEAGLAQGFEYLTRQHADMLKNPALWERCSETDTTFPCGAISDAPFDDDGDPLTAPIKRRGTMYRLRADATNTIPNIDGALSQYMLRLPVASKLGNMANGTPVAYGVAPVVCFVQRPGSTPGGIPCGSGTGTGSTSVSITTFVSVAKLPGENASSTLSQTIGQYPKFDDDLLNKPPITAAGSAGVTGTLQVVTNPNAGGTGVPVSVWSRLDIDKTGTTNTCYADEFFRYTSGSATPSVYQSTIRCDDCRCDSNDSPKTLSYDASGSNRCLNNTADCEGIDILDVDAGTNSTAGYNTGGHEGANFNVKADSLSFPTCEFPPDVFKFVFGVQAWTDSDNDCFNETKAANVIYQNPDNAAGIRAVGPDEAYLYKIADKIIAKTANVPLLKVGQAGTTALLRSSATTGVVWCQENCDIASNQQVGTPDAPVVLILDGPVQIHGVVFGFVFIRDTGNALNPATGSSLPGACPNDCMLTMNAGSAIYGAVVIQGQMKSNGTAAVIYDGNVLQGVIDAGGLVYATLPGAWTDKAQY